MSRRAKTRREAKRNRERNMQDSRIKLPALSAHSHNQNYRFSPFSYPFRPRRYANPFGAVSRRMIAAPPPLRPSTFQDPPGSYLIPLPSLSLAYTHPLIFSSNLRPYANTRTPPPRPYVPPQPLCPIYCLHLVHQPVPSALRATHTYAVRNEL